MAEKGDENQEELNAEEKNLRQGNVSLILDSYDDIFSDFDPRPYGERALSDDFLVECKKAVRDKEVGKFEIRMMVPEKKRNSIFEPKIRKRLKTHFQKHYKEKQTEINQIRANGLLWFIIGAVIIFISTFLFGLEGYFYNLLFVMSEPAGWFTLWTGLEKIFIETKKKQPDYSFYKKMAGSDIYFLSY